MITFRKPPLPICPTNGYKRNNINFNRTRILETNSRSELKGMANHKISEHKTSIIDNDQIIIKSEANQLLRNGSEPVNKYKSRAEAAYDSRSDKDVHKPGSSMCRTHELTNEPRPSSAMANTRVKTSDLGDALKQFRYEKNN